MNEPRNDDRREDLLPDQRKTTPTVALNCGCEQAPFAVFDLQRLCNSGSHCILNLVSRPRSHRKASMQAIGQEEKHVPNSWTTSIENVAINGCIQSPGLSKMRPD